MVDNLLGRLKAMPQHWCRRSLLRAAAWGQVVGYDRAGRVLNYSGVAALTPAEIAAASHKVCQTGDQGAPGLLLPAGRPQGVLACTSCSGLSQAVLLTNFFATGRLHAGLQSMVPALLQQLLSTQASIRGSQALQLFWQGWSTQAKRSE